MKPLTEESPGYYVRGGQVHGRWLVYGERGRRDREGDRGDRDLPPRPPKRRA